MRFSKRVKISRRNLQNKDNAFKKKVIGDYDGQLKVKEYGFEPSIVNGVYHSEEVCIVSRAKPRRVLIFQDID